MPFDTAYSFLFVEKIAGALGIDLKATPVSGITIEAWRPLEPPVILVDFVMTTEIQDRIVEAVGSLRWVPEPETAE